MWTTLTKSTFGIAEAEHKMKNVHSCLQHTLADPSATRVEQVSLLFAPYRDCTNIVKEQRADQGGGEEQRLPVRRRVDHEGGVAQHVRSDFAAAVRVSVACAVVKLLYAINSTSIVQRTLVKSS
jgi:hypothetical protein